MAAVLSGTLALATPVWAGTPELEAAFSQICLAPIAEGMPVYDSLVTDLGLELSTSGSVAHFSGKSAGLSGSFSIDAEYPVCTVKAEGTRIDNIAHLARRIIEKHLPDAPEPVEKDGRLVGWSMPQPYSSCCNIVVSFVSGASGAGAALTARIEDR